MDPVTAAKHTSLHHEDHVDSELPPLLPSMATEGLPPLQQSIYLPDAEKLLMKYVERWQIVSLDSFCLLGLSLTGFIHPGVISVDRLVAVAIAYGILFVLDDLFIDSPDDSLLCQYGIDRRVLDSPDQMKEYLDSLDAIFGQQSKPLQNSVSKIEMMVWELGSDMLGLSNPEWFHAFVESVIEQHQVTVATYADIIEGHNSSLQDLESYNNMRRGNFGGKLVVLLIEFANNSYLSEEIRSLSFMLEARDDAIKHLTFVNDIYSYHKESKLEENPRNVIIVLMESEGKTFDQAVHATIALANLHARNILELELVTSNSAMQSHLQDFKELIAGHLYHSSKHKRYRQPDSPLPELRIVPTFSRA